jgi:hypothetical protein
MILGFLTADFRFPIVDLASREVVLSQNRQLAIGNQQFILKEI